jgi:hypothetical protein
MSRAIASARQRRAGVTPEPPPPPAVAKPQEQSGLTMQQVISVIDNRLIKLEKFMKDTLESPAPDKSVKFAQDVKVQNGINGENGQEETVVDLNEVLDDFNNRFMLLAEEMALLKDTLLKLQTYTMDVNKMLLNERVNVLSDLGNESDTFIISDTTLLPPDVEKLPEVSSENL